MQYLNQSNKENVDRHTETKTYNINLSKNQYYNNISQSNSNMKITNKKITNKPHKSSNTYIKIPSVIITMLTFVLLGIGAYSIFKPEDDPKSDSSIIVEESDASNDSSSISEDFEITYGFEKYKLEFQNLVKNKIDELFNDNLYLATDVCEDIYNILDDYFINYFKVQKLSMETKEKWNKELYTNNDMCDTFRNILKEDYYNYINRELYNKNIDLDCQYANVYTSLIKQYKNILSFDKTPPYAINRLASITGSYATILICNLDKAKYLGFTIQNMIDESLDSIYYSIWDLSFLEYDFPSISYKHDIDYVNYQIGLNFLNLSAIASEDIDKAKYNCMAIYFFDKSYSENFVDNKDNTPTFLKGLCYYNLSNLTLTKNYRSDYLKKSKVFLETFIECNVNTNRKEALDILDKVSNQLM